MYTFKWMLTINGNMVMSIVIDHTTSNYNILYCMCALLTHHHLPFCNSKLGITFIAFENIVHSHLSSYNDRTVATIQMLYMILLVILHTHNATYSETNSMCSKVPRPQEEVSSHSASELDPPPPCRPSPWPRARDVPAPSSPPAFLDTPNRSLAGMLSIPAPLLPCGGRDIIPLHQAPIPASVPTMDIASAIRMVLASIDICVAMVTMYISSTEAIQVQFAHRKQLKRRHETEVLVSPHIAFNRHVTDEDDLEQPHARQIMDLLTWHIGVEDARWYVKPRSTCWFEEYLFHIYTPDMFYDILRMRRRTFDRLVNDLRPFIQGQQTHWRQPIGVEKKVVVTLFKLMHGVAIPLVADRAALGKSTVSGILRQVCTAVSKNFAHMIAWPSGRRLARIATGFQSKQWFPNCIGAIDGSHIYIAAPTNTIVAADHRNRYKSFSILLQGVVDSKCYFTSVNTGPPGSLHDSAHFKSTELFRKAEEGIMGGFHDDPTTWAEGLPFPPYIVADRGYPLLSWCITPFKKSPMGSPLSAEELWFNRKHSSTRMSVERAFGILKSRFKEIGTKSSLKLDFLPTVVHCCCVLHNILLASKDRTLDQILVDCNLPPMDDYDNQHRAEEEVFQPPRPMGLVSEDRALLEGQMARDDILDYLVRIQNSNYNTMHPKS